MCVVERIIRTEQMLHAADYSPLMCHVHAQIRCYHVDKAIKVAMEALHQCLIPEQDALD